jgi:hypothetical protein
MAWYVNVAEAQQGDPASTAVQQLPGNAHINGFDGPFNTKLQAMQDYNKITGGSGGGNGGGGNQGGGWYVITTRHLPPHQTPFHVIVSQKPFPGPPQSQSLEVSGPYNTQAEAQTAANNYIHSRNNPGGIPVSGVAGWLSGLNLENWVLRIGEILLGIVLIGVGIARITGAQNFVSQVVKAKIP